MYIDQNKNAPSELILSPFEDKLREFGNKWNLHYCQSLNNIFLSTYKGEEISEGNCGVLKCSKKHTYDSWFLP